MYSDHSSLPVHAAVEVRSLEMLDILLENGADITAVKKSKEGVIYTAVQRGDVDLCRELLKRGAKPLCRDMFNVTPYYFFLPSLILHFYESLSLFLSLYLSTSCNMQSPRCMQEEVHRYCPPTADIFQRIIPP